MAEHRPGEGMGQQATRALVQMQQPGPVCQGQEPQACSQPNHVLRWPGTVHRTDLVQGDMLWIAQSIHTLPQEYDWAMQHAKQGAYTAASAAGICA